MPETVDHLLRRLQGLEPRAEPADAWGPDEVEEEAAPIVRLQPGDDTHGQEQGIDILALRAHSLAPPECATSRGVPTLHRLCLGCLGQYLEDLLEAGPEVAAALNAQEKLVLLAVARRRGLLDDAMLELLVDEDHTHLELSFSAVTPEGLTAALPALPRLVHLSMLGLDANRELLLALSQHCPRLETLRFGSFMGGPRGGTVFKTLLTLLPSLQGPSADADDWERCSFANEDQATQLVSLKHLVWLGGQAEHLARIRQRCPRLAVNPGPQRFRASAPKALRLPPEADIHRPLDVSAAEGAALDWGALQQQAGEAAGTPQQSNSPRLRPRESIAERFKTAFEERARVKAAKSERNRRQAWRRYVRSNPTAMLIRAAEAGVPLARQ